MVVTQFLPTEARTDTDRQTDRQETDEIETYLVRSAEINSLGKGKVVG